MNYCKRCGKELENDMVVCPHCGCIVQQENQENSSTSISQVSTEVLQSQKNESSKQPVKKRKKIWAVLLIVVLVLGIIAADLFIPRNLKLEDIKETNVVTAIIKYGLPKSITTTEYSGICLHYGDKNKFYGRTPGSCLIYPEGNEVAFFFSEEASGDLYLYSKIYNLCEFKENLLDFDKFSYENLLITTNHLDASYVHIEIN